VVRAGASWPHRLRRHCSRPPPRLARVRQNVAIPPVVNFNVQVDTPVALFQDGINLPSGPATGLPFCVDFSFSHFVSNTPRAKPNFAAQGISYMDMILQSGPLIGTNNFAITKIETVIPGPPPPRPVPM
jgi:hypothetical protein